MICSLHSTHCYASHHVVYISSDAFPMNCDISLSSRSQNTLKTLESIRSHFRCSYLLSKYFSPISIYSFKRKFSANRVAMSSLNPQAFVRGTTKINITINNHFWGKLQTGTTKKIYVHGFNDNYKPLLVSRV